MQLLMTVLIAFVICLVSSLSIAITRSFSSLTRKGLYSIDCPVEGNSNSYVGVEIFGKGIISYKVQYDYLFTKVHLYLKE